MPMKTKIFINSEKMKIFPGQDLRKYCDLEGYNTQDSNNLSF